LDIDVGQIEGNGSKEQKLYVIGRTTPLTRLLNISVSNLPSILHCLVLNLNFFCVRFGQVRYKPSSSSQEPYFEKHETVKIVYNKAFEVKFHSHEQQTGYKNASMFPPSLEEKERLLVIAAVRCTSPWNLQVVSMEMEQDHVRHVRVRKRSTSTPIDLFLFRIKQPSHGYIQVQALPKARGEDVKGKLKVYN
jgi:hypothetical protein